ncbi:MAG TPA: threonine--tRNA ligase [Gammaproteobacteria bacterium]|nr:threonine--tRNA ligase [Xanthomonadales bacterium]MCB1593994.1 threonine--tRNA ligase [Xanthomonadales bacterium]HOP21688.1 threonine--tRNA ligase [Gammaproteobacteria bacterium]HPI95605.1 threonine--tRNA ligase [Gammaproteobacteria bacterium]HPQ86812.1 threonine--tRNA ligase [Gammaproteobacteria bacterium]
MPIITLADGSKREFSNAISAYDVAADIGAGLANAALAAKVNGELVDLSTSITNDATLSIITSRDEEGIEVIRHSTAHLMAQAVKRLFPKVQVTIGPVIENGFYYDFSSEHHFTEEELEKISEEMKKIVKQQLPVERQVISRNDAIKLFENMGEKYKAEIIRDIPEGETLSLYKQGEFIDLCRGPHVPNTSKLKVFKLMNVAGAYWRGNSDNEMLQRIYGTAWGDKKDLKDYLFRLEEAERRDHRKLGKRMSLFHFQEEAPGMVFWHPGGWSLYQSVQQYMRKKLTLRDYHEVNTPQIVDFTLWQRSGHADKFGDDMFSVESEGRKFAVKPMNCPCHIQIFNQGLKSYRDLPLRLAEYGSCHRNEPSGALHGLMRVRGFVQDDGHIFCTEGQIQSEVSEFIDFLHEIYQDFGFTDIIYRLSTRPENRVGSDEIWDKSEQALAQALDNKGLEWQELPGEGAFYGPKIEFSLKDCLGRVWQCGTIQVDFSMPARLDATYIGEDGNKHVPVMLHRAILGSFERFMGILIEHHAGNLPFWLAPVQAVVMSITDAQAAYAENIYNVLQNKGFRVKLDLRNEKIGYKIREHTLEKCSYMLVVGNKEMENGTVTLRNLKGETVGNFTESELLEFFRKEQSEKN